MRIWRYGAAASLAALLAACGPQGQTGESEPAASGDAAEQVEAEGAVAVGEVDADLLAAPNSAFVAIEPSELGVVGAPTVDDALSELIGTGAHEGGGTVRVSVRQTGDAAVADIVRSAIPDDSVSGGHIRIEFRHEPDGWYPTNAYRRMMCARGAMAQQWTTELCP